VKLGLLTATCPTHLEGTLKQACGMASDSKTIKGNTRRHNIRYEVCTVV
jgi:hypothetical protein